MSSVLWIGGKESQSLVRRIDADEQKEMEMNDGERRLIR